MLSNLRAKAMPGQSVFAHRPRPGAAQILGCLIMAAAIAACHPAMRELTAPSVVAIELCYMFVCPGDASVKATANTSLLPLIMTVTL
jgi:hypothetical protein